MAPVALVTLRASVAMAALRQVRRALLRAATLTPARVMVGCTVRFVRLLLLLVFTAPHGINLLRDGRPEHLPEDFTSYIAKAWAARARGASVCWGGAASGLVHAQPASRQACATQTT